MIIYCTRNQTLDGVAPTVEGSSLRDLSVRCLCRWSSGDYMRWGKERWRQWSHLKLWRLVAEGDGGDGERKQRWWLLHRIWVSSMDGWSSLIGRWPEMMVFMGLSRLAATERGEKGERRRKERSGGGVRWGSWWLVGEAAVVLERRERKDGGTVADFWE